MTIMLFRFQIFPGLSRIFYRIPKERLIPDKSHEVVRSIISRKRFDLNILLYQLPTLLDKAKYPFGLFPGINTKSELAASRNQKGTFRALLALHRTMNCLVDNGIID